ncbi:MAG: diphthine synthase [Nitrosopumilus sp.]|nr:diphthine synthase [Nitrosopumilus sp.]CAI9830894.1 Diphthamide biosynthesis methyltransferase [Nitrosopumilaceae archaeon]MDA7941305.1 diphthine synthase [Nitrosopumilus sp.]MDA7942716.1 diphthine synthase [Nitrosopumilus sp.]MDA7945298.1 diphthine synthase [Nitrosopumilus sp.]
MTLWFVGLGISGAASAPARAHEVIACADRVYLERFTSPVPDEDVEVVRRLAGERLVLARRWQVEDGSAILDDAEGGGAALVSYGDPFVATTHAELRSRAISRGIRTEAVHAASAPWAALGECGLHSYKAGRTATVMSEGAATPYSVLLSNVSSGCHTVLLLEYDGERGFFLDPSDALRMLLEEEGAQGRGAVSGGTYCIVASRIGSGDQALAAGRISSLSGSDFGDPPHAVLVPGPLHFTEEEAIAAACKCADPPAGNGSPGTAERMVSRYAPAVRESIREAERLLGPSEVLECAGRYADDAESFLAGGRPEVAVLCVGYADGLVDSAMISSGLAPKGYGARDGGGNG